jgi:hypothetical protein
VFWNIFPIGSNVKLSPAVAAILFSGSCWYMKMQFLMSDFYR